MAELDREGLSGGEEFELDIGMLWFDDDKKRTIDEKIDVAIEFYKNKYKQEPTVCYINDSDFSEKAGKRTLIMGLRIRHSKTIIRNHFWLGVETK